MNASHLALAKPILKASISEALYNEITMNIGGYYYFLGKTLTWSGSQDDTLIAPQNSIIYERQVRDELIFLKKITAAEVSYTVPRYNWSPGTVYDMYDDALGLTISLTGCSAVTGSVIITGSFDPSILSIGYVVSGTGIPVGTKITSSSSTEIIIDSAVTQDFTNSSLTVTNVALSGATTIDQSKFYVYTSEHNVYKCIYNGGGVPSTVQPSTMQYEVFKTGDGYMWKYMYTVPSSMINRFVTSSEIPVTTALKNQYYSRGAITSVTLQNYGSNYQVGDSLTVVGDGHIKENPYKLVAINIDVAGSGYSDSNPPTIVVEDPYAALMFGANTTYVLGDYVKSDSNIYLVVAAGTTGTVAPTHTDTTYTLYNGTCGLRFVGRTITATAVVSGGVLVDTVIDGIIGYVNLSNVGSGYDPLNPPLVTINSTSGGTGATAVANVSVGGWINSIVVTNRGNNYRAETTTVTIASPPVGGTGAAANVEIYYGFGYPFVPSVTIDQSPSGTNAEASIILERTTARINPIIENGQITNVAIVDPGEGYTTATIIVNGHGIGADITPNLSIGDLNSNQANIELTAIPGSIDVIMVVNTGSNYVTASVDVVGDGTGCVAEPIIEAGRIVGITVTNPGSGYTRATATITGSGNNLVPAYARCIVSPVNGHGYNAVKELYAGNISLSTTIAKDKNNGFEVDNDYRQIGIIKNPDEYGTGLRYNSRTGSACYTITGGFDFNSIAIDQLMLDAGGHKYRIVAIPSSSSTSTLTVLVQSIDNAVPKIGDEITYGATLNKTAAIVYVNYPDIDKYSGEMLFIDNRIAFQPTNEQSVSIKTSIKF